MNYYYFLIISIKKEQKKEIQKKKVTDYGRKMVFKVIELKKERKERKGDKSSSGCYDYFQIVPISFHSYSFGILKKVTIYWSHTALPVNYSSQTVKRHIIYKISCIPKYRLLLYQWSRQNKSLKWKETKHKLHK